MTLTDHNSTPDPSADETPQTQPQTKQKALIAGNIFNTEELSDFIENGKADLCSLLLEHLFDKLKRDGISESDLVFGMMQYCRKRNYPQKLIDNLQASASDLWCIGRGIPVPDID